MSKAREIFTETDTFPEHITTEHQQKGWASVPSIFLNPEALDVQVTSHIVWTLERNLVLAENTEAPYRAYGNRAEDGSRTPVQVQADEYWEARSERLRLLIEELSK